MKLPEGAMSDELLRELRQALWSAGLRCSRGHGAGWRHEMRLIEAWHFGSKQQAIQADIVLRSTRIGLSAWFSAIDLVDSGKGGGTVVVDSQRQSGLGRYRTAWRWSHENRRATTGFDRAPSQIRIAVDETRLDGAGPSKSGSGASGKTVVAGAVEAETGSNPGSNPDPNRDKVSKRPLGRGRLAAVRAGCSRDSSPASNRSSAIGSYSRVAALGGSSRSRSGVRRR